MLLDIKPKDLRLDFIKRYASRFSGSESDLDLLLSEVVSFHRKGNGTIPQYIHNMRERWYSALDSGFVDYGVYDDDFYFTDLWACWVVYSRAYLKSLIHPNSLEDGISVYSILKDSRVVADLGCGLGYSTAALSEIFNTSDVYGTNLAFTWQYKFCQDMSSEFDFKVVPDIQSIGKNVDLVFASEYFEHILDPIAHLGEIIHSANPKAFVIANAFNTYSIGHFRVYECSNMDVPQDKISRIFNDTLRDFGYKKLKTKIWNNRPAIWIKR